MTDKLNISVIITIVTILLSVGGSFAVIKAKTDKVDAIEERSIDTDKRLTKMEVVVSNIDENMKEQRELIKEQKSDLKEILRALKQ